MPATPRDHQVPRAEEVFISYSRKDKDFVRRLDEELKRRDREAWVDWEGIPPGDTWEKTIYGAIEATHTFIFVLTPDSIASAVCAKEIAHAAANNKRLVPVVYRDVAPEKIPKSLSELNWIFFRDSDDFKEAADKLICALDTDLKWVRAHTRLLTRAVEWDANGRSNSFVLRGEDLRAAERWLAEAGAQKERQPTAFQTEYIIASRKASARRQRITLGAVTFGLIVSIVLGVVAFFARQKALEQEAKAKAETSHSEYLRALSLVEDGDADEALRSLARSLELEPSNSAVATRLINLLGQRQWPHLAATQNHPLPISVLDKNADGSGLIVATRSAGEGGRTASQFVHFYDADTLHRTGRAEVGSHDIEDLQVNGDRLLASSTGSTAFLFNLKTGAQLKVWEGSVANVAHGAFSTDGKWAFVWFKKFPIDTTPEIVLAEDGTPHLPLPHAPAPTASSINDPILSTVMMTDADVRTLNGDGSVTVQPFDSQTPARPLPVMQDADVLLQPPYSDKSLQLARFGFGGNVLLGVRRNGEVHIWRLSQSEARDTLLTSSGLTLLGIAAGKATASFRGDDQVIIVAQDLDSSMESAHSCVTRIVRGAGGDSEFKVDTNWYSPFRLVRVLSSGIAVAQATKSFVLPFHGGSLSGPLRHDSQITAICEVKEGLLATGAADGAVKLWNLTPPAFVVAPRSGPLEKKGTALLAQSQSGDVEIWGSGGEIEPLSLVINQRGKVTKLKVPPKLSGIRDVELSADGKRGIFSGYANRQVREGSGAWVFNVDDGTLASKSVGISEWAGFSPDAKQVLTIDNGSLQFWNLRPDEKGRFTFEETDRVLPPGATTGAPAGDQRVVRDGDRLTTPFQAGMNGAAAAEHGGRLATRSHTGDLIVWDATAGKPLHLLKGDPLWYADFQREIPEELRGVDRVQVDEEGRPVDPLGECNPALSADGRRLAAAYGRAFVLWDADSGKPLSDAIYCAGEIQSLHFRAGDPSKVEATLRDGSKVSWDYADLGGALAQADATALRQLAIAVADDKWVDETPRLATNAHSSSPVVMKLLQHFASQSRALSNTATKPSPAPPR